MTVRLFIYEYSVVQPESSRLPSAVRREGHAMYQALLKDAAKLQPRVEVICMAQLQDTQKEKNTFCNTIEHADYALIIAPEFHKHLEERCRWVEESNCKLLGPGSEAVRLTSDKWKLYQHWQNHGVRTPMTWLPSMPSPISGPYVRKHRWGAGSLDLLRFNDHCQLEAHHIVQQYISGQVVSQSSLIGSDREIYLLPSGLQQISDDGTFSYQGGILPLLEPYRSRMQRLTHMAVQEISGLQGYVGVDAILGDAEDGSQDYVLEINPRVTTSYLGLRALAKTNLLQAMLELAQGERPAPFSWHDGPIKFSPDGRMYSLS